MKKKLFFILSLLLLQFYMFSSLPVFAASAKLNISYEPASPNFTTGQQNVVTAILQPSSGNISAASVSFKTTGGLKIVKVLDALDGSNKPLTNTKFIDQDVSDKAAKITILVMKATADLPSVIKIPVVVSGKAGNLQIDTKESQVVDGNGVAYTVSQQKASYITFSENGKDTLPVPTPTSLPANTTSVNLTMKFQGIKPADVKTKTISGVKVQLVQGSQYSLPQFITVTMDQAGIWHGTAVFSNIKPGNEYAVLIKGPKHLQTRINGTLSASGVMQMVGDVGIQDGILNAYDLSFVQNTIRKSSKSSVTDADVNYDGKVNKTDYDLLVYTLKNTSGLDQR